MGNNILAREWIGQKRIFPAKIKKCNVAKHFLNIRLLSSKLFILPSVLVGISSRELLAVRCYFFVKEKHVHALRD